MGAREVLSLMGSSYIREAERGKILNNFCRIDFCLDVFICIHEGVFENKVQWVDLKKEFEEDGRYATTGKKIKTLRGYRLIRDHTRAQLSKALNIRNVLAHQYMPEAGLGLAKTDLERYPTIITAIELIYGAAWIELLKDYSPHQLEVAQWLLSQSSIQ